MSPSPIKPSTRDAFCPDFPKIPAIGGVRFALASTGIKYQGRDDVMVAHLAPGTAIAGIFTRSATRSASILDAEEKLKIYQPAESPAAFIVNSSNANAFTGMAGEETVRQICNQGSTAFGCSPSHIFTSSTGVIGEWLDPKPITKCFADMNDKLSQTAFENAARAIMTTDASPKGAFSELTLGKNPVTIAGIAKGAGMIAPDMATMLAYLFTDAKIEQKYLQHCLLKYAQTTFNAITVDGDTSPSDCVLIAATQHGRNQTLTATSKDAPAFEEALERVMRSLSHQIVRDGEGAKKFVEITVISAQNQADARKVAFSIANSPLFKTALAGQDPNWGRIVMAVGKSGAAADRDRLTIYFGSLRVAHNGAIDPAYLEENGAAYMKNDSLEITVDLGLGQACFTVWTCDLTHDYISINADYRS